MGAQADQVRDDILDRIFDRSLLPGEKIDEQELRDRHQLSGTPIREALISLEATGIIERRPRGGACLAALDLEGLMKMIEMLAEAEGAMAYLAARRVNKAQASVLQAAADNCVAYANGQNDLAHRYYDLNLKFHAAVIDAAGNEHMKKNVYQTGTRLISYLSARHDRPGEELNSANGHMEICHAILSSDGDAARSLMIRHVSFSDQLALDVMNAMKDR